MNPFDTYRQLQEDAVDSVSLDVPLLIRIMEVCREEIKDDEELHKFATQIVALKDRGVLGMKDWDDLCTCSKTKKEFVEEETQDQLDEETDESAGKVTHVFHVKTTHPTSPIKKGVMKYSTRKDLETARAHVKKHYEGQGHTVTSIMHHKTVPFKGPSKSTPEQRMKARERHWHKTGVSKSTTDWMRKQGWL